MFNRISHWGWLLVFAACNLAFWVGVAVAVALAVSDEVDLGVETVIRERQATAAVALEKVIARTSQETARSTAVFPGPSPAATDAIQSEPTAIATPSPSRTPFPMTPVQRTEELAPSSTATAVPTAEQPDAQPEETLVGSPLLMSDPEFSSLLNVTAEMRRSAGGRAVQIRYDEAALNRELEKLLQRDSDLPYENVYVDLKRDQVILTGDVEVLRFQVGAEAVGRVAASDCLPQLEVQSITIAGVLTPGFVKEQITETLQRALDWYPTDYPLCLDQIVLEEGRATVYGHRR